MAQSNHERIGRALELLNVGLRPFVEREMQAAHGDNWIDAAQAGLREDRATPKGKQPKRPNWDTQALLAVMWGRLGTMYSVRHLVGQNAVSLVNFVTPVTSGRIRSPLRRTMSTEPSTASRGC